MTPEHPGEIRADAVYTVEELRLRINVSKTTMHRLLHCDGLEFAVVHRRRYVLGKSWFEHVEKQQNAANGDGD